MNKLAWKKWFLSVASGAVLFQTNGCVETATGLTAIFSAATAGGVFYLVSRIIRD